MITAEQARSMTKSMNEVHNENMRVLYNEVEKQITLACGVGNTSTSFGFYTDSTPTDVVIDFFKNLGYTIEILEVQTNKWYSSVNAKIRWA